MKKIIAIAIVSLLAIVGAIYFDFTSGPKKYEVENRTYDAGYEEGKSIGYGIGYDEGYESGCDQGYSEGYDEGYSDGESDGYYAGATYACLFFGDVDRAFQSASNGAAWYTFVDAYDQYISNIYDDDETRSSLHWAIIGALNETATEEEKELLISTFGEDLFIRNGVTFSP